MYIKIGEQEVPISDIKNALSETGFIVRQKEEEEEFLNRFKDTKIKEYSRSLFESVEGTVGEVTGIQKNPDEKATDFLKRAMSEKLMTLKQIQEENEALKKGGDSSELYKKQLEQVQAEAAAKIEAANLKVSEYEKAVFNSKIEAATGVKISELRASYNQDLPADLVKNYEFGITQKLKSLDVRADESGRLLVYENGMPKVDEHFKQIDVNTYLENELKPLLGNKQVAGAGTKVSKSGSYKTEGGKVVDFAGVTNKTELMNAIQKAGLRQFTGDFDLAWSEGLNFLSK